MQIEENLNFVKLDTGNSYQLAYPDNEWLSEDR